MSTFRGLDQHRNTVRTLHRSPSKSPTQVVREFFPVDLVDSFLESFSDDSSTKTYQIERRSVETSDVAITGGVYHQTWGLAQQKELEALKGSIEAKQRRGEEEDHAQKQADK